MLVVYTLPRRPFSRSYGANLPSSLTEVIPFPLVFSTRLPVSVCGTGTQVSLEAFLGSLGSVASTFSQARHHSSAQVVFYPHSLHLQAWHRLFQPPANLPFYVSPSLKQPDAVLEY